MKLLVTSNPLNETIYIIVSTVYNQFTKQPPSLEKGILRLLLKTSCTEAPSICSTKTYFFKKSVAMGTSLGPTSIDYHTASMENNEINVNYKFNPTTYIRCFDDTIVLFNAFSHIIKFINCGLYIIIIYKIYNIL